MGDLLKAIEYLGIPATIAIALVVLFVVLQVIGEIVEIFGKVSPELLKVRKYFARKKKEEKEKEQTLKEVKQLLCDVNTHYSDDNISKRNNWITNVNNSIASNDKLIQSLDTKIDKLLLDNESFKDQLGQVKDNVLENEADRLRSELFDCGNRCRRNIRLHPEEMEHIRVVFNKYSNVLHQNGPGEAEFKFITDYYNHQDFPTYHEQNKQTIHND